MYFGSLAQLWSMDGHGPYVWGAYAIVAGVIVVLVRGPLQRHRRALDQVRRRVAGSGTANGGG